jgi:hypothetical protein
MENDICRKTLDKDIVKDSINLTKAKKWIIRWPIFPVDTQYCPSAFIGEYRERMSLSEWPDFRNSTPKNDDPHLNDASCVIKDCATKL